MSRELLRRTTTEYHDHNSLLDDCGGIWGRNRGCSRILCHRKVVPVTFCAEHRRCWCYISSGCRISLLWDDLVFFLKWYLGLFFEVTNRNRIIYFNWHGYSPSKNAFSESSLALYLLWESFKKNGLGGYLDTTVKLLFRATDAGVLPSLSGGVRAPVAEFGKYCWWPTCKSSTANFNSVIAGWGMIFAELDFDRRTNVMCACFVLASSHGSWTLAELSDRNESLHKDAY